LQTLRGEGLTVGPRELIWLHHLFKQAPILERERFQEMLGCVLAKTPAQRRRFDGLFDLWLDKVSGSPTGRTLLTPAETNSKTSEKPSAEENVPAGPKPPKPRARWGKAITLGVEVGILLFLLEFLINLPYISMEKIHSITVDHITTPPIFPGQGTDAALPDQPTPHYWSWVPKIEKPEVVTSPFWPLLGFGLVTLGLTGWLWRRYQHAVRLPEGLAPPAPGPDWLPLLPPESTGPELLSAEQVRNAVWSVGRFISEEYTPKLDLPRTVAATARAGGIAMLKHQRALYDREVWLWMDEQAEQPALLRLARELQSSLQRAGLPVRSAWFYGLPYQLTWEEGYGFDPLVWEGHRGSVIVAILTDGQSLLRAWQNAHRRPRLKRSLHALGQWPRLAFVEFAPNGPRLAGLLEGFEIPCIGPDALPLFLGEHPEIRRAALATAFSAGARRLWAAAACLDGDAIDDATALALHRHLDSDLPALAIQALWRSGTLQAGRLSWSARQRAEHLNWLSRAERLDPSRPVPASSLLGQALSFWRARYTRERAQRRRRESALKPWRDTQADRELRFKQALVDLWDRPEQAARRLYALFKAKDDGTFRQALDKALPRYYPSDLYRLATHEPQAIRLPWNFQAVPARAHYLFALMGLGGKRLNLQSQIQPTGGFALLLGVITGLGVAAIGASLTTVGTNEACQFQVTHSVFDHPVFRRFTICKWQRTGPDRYRYVVGAPKHLVSDVTSAGQTVTLDWRWEARPNVQQLDGAQLWHAGTLPQPLRACAEHWPRRSLAVIAADPDGDIAARRLATRLLDRGGVDTVLLGTDWPRHLDTLTGGARIASAQDQLLVILPPDAQPPPALDFPGEVAAVRAGDFEELARALKFPGARKVSEVWGGESELRLWGGPEVAGEVGGMELVTVCGGTFSMGSPDDEKGALSNEHPRHPVTLDTFAIGKFEVTFAEYDQFAKATGRRNPVDEGWGRGNRPVINVSWDEARAFCQHYKLDKLDLPTEAQWEYAARAGTITAYWWGDDIGRNRANCYNCGSQWDNKETAPVGSFDPNPSGLHDTAGNVWEWTRDCYQSDLYKNRKADQTTLDPLVDSMACKYRSLRGGSFDLSAEDLRSAVRGWNGPGDWGRISGFRCVRAPRRQP
jgi:formylglycine-generating enzyme required for sulfatase activity